MSAAAALGAIAISPIASAQSEQAAKPAEGAQEVQEVVVTGIRSSIEGAQEIKKNAEVFVDSVTAEDIGALPDRSVTEALQRIPGVSINRFQGANDPDHFSIEGSGVVVRGLNQVRSELNGRDTFSANSGRFLSFSDVAPELLYGVDVYKNQSADMIEGGLAGTVNLRTRVPFDQRGQLIGGSLEGNYGDFAEEFSPTGSFLYSNRWETGHGDFGFLGNIVYSELKSRSDGIQASSFRPRTDLVPGQTVYAPEGAAFRTQDFERERTGGAVALQWENADDTMLATIQFMRSDAQTAWAEHAMEIATDNVGDTAFYRVPGTPAFTFNDSGVFTSGVVSAPVGWRDDQNRPGNGNDPPRIPQNGLQSNNIVRSVDQKYMTQDIGFNLKFTPSDELAINFDFQHVDSTVENLDMTIWGSTYQNASIDLTGDLPKVQFLPVHQVGNVPNCTGVSGNCPTYFSGTHNNFQDPFNSFWRSAMDHAEDSQGTEDALRFDLEHKWGDENFLRGQKFGARWAERDQINRSTTYNWGVLSEIWGGGGPVWFDDPVDGVPNGNSGNLVGTPSAGATGPFTFDNFMRGKSPVPAVVPFYNATDLVGGGYQDLVDFALQISSEWRANNGTDNTWEPLADTRRASGGPLQEDSYGGKYLPREINTTNERTQSLYYMLRFGHDFANDMTLSGNVGVRWVRTEFDATGVEAAALPGALPSEATCNPAPPQQVPAGFCQIPADERARARRFATGQSVDIEASNKYENWLPSLNVKLGLSEELLMRFGFSKAMARPDLGLMRYYSWVEPYVVNNVWQGWQIRTGNPYLEPTTSTQYDLATEWYFAKSSSLTLSLFYKELKNVLTNEVTLQPTTWGGETYNVRRPKPINSSETGKVQGFELAYQQFYDQLPGWLSGFGIQANYTYIDSNGVTQSVLNSGGSTGTAENEANIDTSLLPLQGLSEDNVNFALIYEKGPVSARAAYNWRSEFLLTTRDVITPFAPIMQEATGQLDASFFYSFNDHVKVGIQGVNLTNEVTKTSQVLNDQLVQAGRSWFMNDRRYSVGVRVSF